MRELVREIEFILPKLAGWCSLEKATWFAETIVMLRPDLAVELGVFGGSSFIPMALAMRHNRVKQKVTNGMAYGVDPYSTDCALECVLEPEHREWWGKEDLSAIRTRCEQAITTLCLEKDCQLVVEKSDDSAVLFEFGSIGFLHIDANHSVERSCRDVDTWLPKVKKGGIVVLDDIDWPTVTNARDMIRSVAKVVGSFKTWEAYRTF